MSARRILITGGTGLLGGALLDAATEGEEVFATYYHNLPPAEWRHRFYPLDVRDEAAVMQLLESVRPHIVIHTASRGSVDEAERDPDGVRRVNVDGTLAVARVCARLGARVVFISSNAVFDGAHPPYAEDSPVRAMNRYGALKIEAEARLRELRQPHLVIRPILMYGWPWPGGRENVVTRWLSQLEQGQPVEVAADVTSMPLLSTNCAQAVWAAARLGRCEIYHVAGADRVSLVEFARATAREFDADERLVVAVPSAQLSGLAPRPLDTSFVTARMERELGVRPVGIAEGLASLHRTRILAS